MTARKHLKQLVRERMRKTGERYTVARRHIADAETSWEFRGGGGNWGGGGFGSGGGWSGGGGGFSGGGGRSGGGGASGSW